MSNKLEQLRKLTTVVADTGEIDAIKSTNLKMQQRTHLLS